MRAVTFGTEELAFDTLLVASVADGSWESTRGRIVRGLEASACGVVTSPADLTAARTAFRSARGLLADDDLNAWLTARSVTLEQWRSHTILMLLAGTDRAAPPHRGDAGAARMAAAVAVRVEDFLGPAAHTLLLGAAAKRTDHVDDDRVAALVEKVRSEPALPLLDRSDDQICGHAASVIRLREQLELAQREVDEHEMIAVIHANLVDWTTFDYDEIVLPTSASAKEAALCVRLDGSDLASVGELAGATLRHQRHTAETAGPAEAFLVGAVVGEAMGPIESPEGWRVAVLRDRRAPDPDDASVRARARDEVIERSLGRRLAGRVTWHVVC
jgi:hypothetical protein